MARKMRVPHRVDTPPLSQIADDLSLPLERIGIVIVDHGSRREQSNQMLMEVVRCFNEHTSFSIVEPAHMELAEPTIDGAFSQCVGQGAELDRGGQLLEHVHHPGIEGAR